MKLELAETVKDLLQEEQKLEIPVNWVSEEAALGNYLQQGYGGAFNLTQEA